MATEDRRARLIALCSLCYLLDSLSNSIMGPLGPAIAKALHLSLPDLGAVFSANLAGQSIGLIVIPMFQSAIGARRIIIFCTACFGVLQIASGLAQDGEQLIALRFLTGAALAGPLPLCLALAAEAVPPRRRGASIMTLFVGYSLGNVAAGLLPEAFPGPSGWRATLCLAGGACIAATIAEVIWLREPAVHRPIPQTRASSPPWRQIALQNPAWRLFSPGRVLGTLLIWAVFVCALIVSYCVNTWLPSLLSGTGRSAALSATSVSAFATGGLAAAFVVGWLIDLLGAVRVLTGFFLSAALCLFVIGRSLVQLSDHLLVAWLAAAGFFMLGGYAGINVLVADYYPAPLRAAGAGWAKSVGRLGSLLAPLMIGVALARGGSEQAVMALFALPALAAAGAVGWIGRLSPTVSTRSPKVAQPEEPVPERL